MRTDIADYFVSDEAFDMLWPIHVRELSELHWTPLEVAKVAAQFLAPDADARIIDIGAGVGKFCIAGRYYTHGNFTGIEQRKALARIGNKVASELGMACVELRHANFMDVSLAGFTGIYFYNSFHENIAGDGPQDEKIERSPELYERYTEHLSAQLSAMPAGTRLATYWLSITEIPNCYQLRSSHFNDLLKLWVRA
jgi:hypothetical protein